MNLIKGVLRSDEIAEDGLSDDNLQLMLELKDDGLEIENLVPEGMIKLELGDELI